MPNATMPNTPPAASSDASNEPDRAPAPRLLVPCLVVALVAWGIYLATGAAFPEVGPVPTTPTADKRAEAPEAAAPVPATAFEQFSRRIAWENFRPWRGAVVLACSAGFLAWFWGLQRLYVRRHPR